MPKKNVCSCLIFVFVCATSSAQTNLDVQIENLGPAGGLFLTPVWVGFHDGGFDVFDVGGMASAELETIAEEGDIGPLSASFAGNGVDGGVAPGTPFGPAGSSFASQATATFNVNPTSHRYFSFASMIIPSNDAFIGNDNPTAFSLFDGAGVFQGPLVIEVTGQNIYDAGTEVNNGQGAAFSATGGMATDEALPIALHLGLANFIGTETANMETILSAFASSTPIARITITESIPEPSSALLLCGIALPLWGMVRRRTIWLRRQHVI